MTSANLIGLFSLNTSSGIPIYRQLIDQIKQSIRMGLLRPGDLLPSVRNLASALQINPMTISKAFAQLELENVLERKRGVGMRVAEQEASEALDPNTEEALNAFLNHAKAMGLDDESIITLVQQTLSIDKNLNQSAESPAEKRRNEEKV